MIGSEGVNNTLKVASAEFSVIAHATESIDKVQAAVLNLLPSDLRGRITFKQNETTGHHGNPIFAFRFILTDPEEIKRFLTGAAARLSSLDRIDLSNEFDKSIDSDGNLYLRFSKQAAFFGKVQLKQEDAIKLKIKFHGRNREFDTLRVVCKELGLID